MTEILFLLQNAIFSLLLSSIASGVIGSYVVIKRLVFLSGSIAHSILGGIGLFVWLQKSKGIAFAEPIYGAFVAAILSAIFIGVIQLYFKQKKDALIASVWSIGMATGVIFISLTPGYTVELTNFLFGNILWVSSKELYLLLALDLFLLAIVSYYYAPFLALCFDEEQAYLQGVKTKVLYLLLLTLIAVSIVILIQIIGIILVIALLSFPAMIASFFTHRLFFMMILSTIFSAFLGLLGITLSYLLNFPIGSTIALTCAFAFVTVLIGKNYIAKKLF